MSTCVRSVLVHAGETWPLCKDDLSRIKRSDHAMIRWICGVRLDQQHATDDLLQKLHIDHVEEVLEWNRLRLCGHRYRQEDNTWTKKIMNFEVDGPTPRGQQRLRWKDVIKSDLNVRGIDIQLATNRCKWRAAIKPPLTQRKNSDPP